LTVVVALYGPNGDAAFRASAKDWGRGPLAWPWVVWVASVGTLAAGLLGDRPFLVVVGAVGVIVMSVWSVGRWRRARRWRRMSRAARPDHGSGGTGASGRAT
jgi:hypothetical protein